MDQLNALVNQEAARRELSILDALDHDGLNRKVDWTPKPVPIGQVVLERAINLIPRIGMIKSVVDAGAVGDGTLEHARRMGWVK